MRRVGLQDRAQNLSYRISRTVIDAIVFGNLAESCSQKKGQHVQRCQRPCLSHGHIGELRAVLNSGPGGEMTLLLTRER